MSPSTRFVELVLVSRSGDVLGALPSFEVETPWWQEAAPIVDGARRRFGLDIVVLRVLSAERPEPPGGRVVYLVELADPEASRRIPAIRPAPPLPEGDPRRMPWARPGGPTADLAWARGAWEDAGIRGTGAPIQVRTWNLSSVWRIPTDVGDLWLKHVPPFFAHEGALIERLAGGAVPSLVARDGARILMREIRGVDMYDAEYPVLARGVVALVALQRRWSGRVGELLALGLPDWRLPALAPAIADVVVRTADELDANDRVALDLLVDGLADRSRRIEACGLPDTLVHGDFSPGNLRGDRASLVLLDWGDSGAGHPLFDQAAMLERAPLPARRPLEELWAREWRSAVPGSDPRRAAGLLAPVAAARQAVIYRRFLDGIEPSEHPYHRGDPARWLGEAAHRLRAEMDVEERRLVRRAPGEGDTACSRPSDRSARAGSSRT